LRFRATTLVPLVVLGFGLGTASAKDPPLLSLTMEHFRDTATVNDDPLHAKATITTENGYVEHTGLMRMVWHDEFLSAVIDQSTGQKSFQIDAEITYSGSWRSYQSANYPTANGRRSVPATQISKEAANCATGDCIYTEHIAFPVDEQVLRQVAAGRVAAKPAVWPYQAIAKSGPAYTGGLSDAEVAGFLVKVDEYAAKPVVAGANTSSFANSASAIAANAANAPSQPDLGVGGLPVAATAEQPNRAGILIIAVNRGSVAQKSGIIVGDILYEFDGHPIKALAELQTAVAAARAASSAIPIKLYRGTEPIAVLAHF
jgi:PDZ domain-containing protein